MATIFIDVSEWNEIKNKDKYTIKHGLTRGSTFYMLYRTHKRLVHVHVIGLPRVYCVYML